MVASARADPEADRPVIGRSEARREIELLLEEARQGAGRGLLLTGPGGVGKSALLEVAVREAGRRNFGVGVARALGDELPAPFSLVRDLANSLAQPAAPAAAPPASGPVSPLLGPILGAAGGHLPAGPTAPAEAPADDVLDQILPPAGGAPGERLGAGQSRLHNRLVAYFLARATERPLLLAIDDLPFADPSSLEFVRRLSAELGAAALAIVATVGTDVAVPERSRPLLTALMQLPAFRPVAVRPFSVGELTEFATWLQQGTPPDPAEAERWHAQTDGNPLFVEQIVRSRLAGGPHDVAGAQDLAGVLGRRIESLDDLDRRLLTYAAALGRQVDFARLAAASGTSEERVSESIDRLVAAGVLREKAGEVYEFVSESLRVRVYSELTETRRRILHRRIGAALEGRGGASDFELARQFYLGQELPKAAEYNRRAADAAARAFAFDAAISHLARALDAERRRPDRDAVRELRLLTETGRLLHESGELVRSEERLDEAVALVRSHEVPALDRGRALLALAWTRFDRGLFAPAEELGRESVALLERAGTSGDRLSAHRLLGNIYWRTGELARAEQHLRTALEIAERAGTQIEHGHALIDVANTLVPQGRAHWETALAMYSRAADLLATGDDAGARARVLMDRAVLEYTAGRTAEAFQDIEVALAAAEQSRSPLWIGYCLLNIAQWKAEAGEVAAGTAAIGRAADVLRPLDDRLASQQLAMSRGMLDEADGRFDEAEAEYTEALDLARTAGLVAEASEMYYRLAGLARRRGDPDAARVWLTAARENGLERHRPDLLPKAEALARELGPP